MYSGDLNSEKCEVTLTTICMCISVDLCKCLIYLVGKVKYILFYYTPSLLDY